MGGECFFFAGGGTGGHIYPGIAVAQQLIKLKPQAKIHFFCSNRSIDLCILKQTGFEYTQLSARSFSLHPNNLIMTLMGAGLLWVGWFGFNAGSSVASGLQTAQALTVTQIAAATAALTWIIIEAIKLGKVTRALKVTF